jgi:hypothetical protein
LESDWEDLSDTGPWLAKWPRVPKEIKDMLLKHGKFLQFVSENLFIARSSSNYVLVSKMG